jgi:hypothetical protein
MVFSRARCPLPRHIRRDYGCVVMFDSGIAFVQGAAIQFQVSQYPQTAAISQAVLRTRLQGVKGFDLAQERLRLSGQCGPDAGWAGPATGQQAPAHRDEQDAAEHGEN